MRIFVDWRGLGSLTRVVLTVCLLGFGALLAGLTFDGSWHKVDVWVVLMMIFISLWTAILVAVQQGTDFLRAWWRVKRVRRR